MDQGCVGFRALSIDMVTGTMENNYGPCYFVMFNMVELFVTELVTCELEKGVSTREGAYYLSSMSGSKFQFKKTLNKIKDLPCCCSVSADIAERE